MRSLMVLLVAQVCVLGALWAPDAGAQARPNLVGSYFCQIEDEGTVYAPQPCTIRRTAAGALLFEKTGGSQRFSLIVLPTDSGFRAAGLFFCPMGACDEVVQAVFTANAEGWTGTLRPGYVVSVGRRRQTRPATP